MVGLCDKEDRLTKESYHSDSVDEAESYQYNERNELTKRTVAGDTASAIQSISQRDIENRILYTGQQYDQETDRYIIRLFESQKWKY